ncbi:MAG: hypothetical protein DRJ03_08050 [Chloroflexi bacterium]|nr:MAG: hypothetical protein DRJ03_08050 [Chloroflexota bacterium]
MDFRGFGGYNVKIPPTVFVNESSAKTAWAKLIIKILNGGCPVTTEYGVNALDVCGTVVIGVRGIKELLNIDAHKQDPFGKQRIIEYMREYRRDEIDSFNDFDYTYLQLLTTPVDQLKLMRDALANDDSHSKRIQAITVRDVEEFWSMSAKPCLQRIWIRKLNDSDAEVHLSWRSRDAFSAFTPNLCTIMRMLKDEVLKPNGLSCVKLVDMSDSYHIYEHDIKEASKVRL